MIEVEKKFQPTEEELAAMLLGAEFMSEKVNHDIFYDLPDFPYLKQGMRLRNRNGRFELKIDVKGFEKSGTAHNEEIENYLEILERLGFDKGGILANIVAGKMEPWMEIKTKRKTYHKGEFIIDIDETDFGYDVVEIEMLVEDNSKVKEAEEKILDFAKSYGWEMKDLPGKGWEYLRRVKPELYLKLKNN